MRFINMIVVHAAATTPEMDIGRDEIRRWHRDRGFSDIGYHWVIRRDGTVEAGRHPTEPGAHAAGHNETSLGICMVGGINAKGDPDSNFTQAQYHALDSLLLGLRYAYPGAVILGHRDLPGVAKACPCFDVGAFLSNMI